MHRHTARVDEGDMFLPKGEPLAQRRGIKLLDIILGETHKKREVKCTEDYRNTILAGDDFTSRRTERKLRALITTYSKAVEWRERNVLIIGSFDDGISAANLFSARQKRSKIQGGSNMTGTDLCVNKPHCAAAVRP